MHRWLRRDNTPPAEADWDARREQAVLAETVMRTAARLLDNEDASTLIAEFCNALVGATPHLRLCWTWFGAPDAPQIVPQVMAGPAQDYARALVIERSLLTQIGPAFRVLAGRRLEPFNVSARSLYGPWRDAAREHGVRSTLAVPLASTVDEQRGIFVIYADVPGYFDAVGVGLFEALGILLSSVLSQTARTAQLAEAARTDALTGAYNRSHAEQLHRGLYRVGPADRPVGLLMLDLDHFKRINDLHGHAGGDRVLTATAAVLKAALRRADGIARWGGEEFVVWLPGSDAAGAATVAEKIRAEVERSAPALPGADALRVTVSIGVAELGVGESVPDALLRADRALYAAKQAGRNRVVVG